MRLNNNYAFNNSLEKENFLEKSKTSIFGKKLTTNKVSISVNFLPKFQSTKINISPNKLQKLKNKERSKTLIQDRFKKIWYSLYYVKVFIKKLKYYARV